MNVLDVHDFLVDVQDFLVHFVSLARKFRVSIVRSAATATA